MPLFECPDCNNNISTNAVSCPNCGNRNFFVEIGAVKVKKSRYFEGRNNTTYREAAIFICLQSGQLVFAEEKGEYYNQEKIFESIEPVRSVSGLVTDYRWRLKGRLVSFAELVGLIEAKVPANRFS